MFAHNRGGTSLEISRSFVCKTMACVLFCRHQHHLREQLARRGCTTECFVGTSWLDSKGHQVPMRCCTLLLQTQVFQLQAHNFRTTRYTVYINTHSHARTHTHTYIYIYNYIFFYDVCVCMYACMYTYIYIYIYNTYSCTHTHTT